MPRRHRWAVPGTVLPLVLLVVWVATVAAGQSATIGLTRQRQADGTVRVTAAVADASGEPIEGATVTFRVKTAFGWLQVAEVESRADGTAAIVLPAEAPYTEIRADAGEGEAGMLAAPAARPAPAVRPGRAALHALSPQPGFISPYPAPQMLILGAILGGIWSTYAYLVLLLAKIRRLGSSGGAG